MKEREVVVLGGGPGGYAAAFHAAQLGMKVVLVNAEHKLGGVCLLRGCIPSKALLHVARLLNESREAREFGITFGPPEIDLDRLRAWKKEVVEKLTDGVEELCRRHKVEVIRAHATFVDSRTLQLSGNDRASNDGQPAQLHYEHLILATGSSPVIPETFRLDDPRVMDSSSALDLPDIPGRLLVIGGGYIGLEMGCVYAALGSKVTVVELTDGLLPGADRDLVRPLQGRLNTMFEGIFLNTAVEQLKVKNGGIAASLRGQDVPAELDFDRVLVAVGRRPNSNEIGLESTRVTVDDRGFVKVDGQQRTDDPHILAIGDVAGEPMLAHKAFREAAVAVEALAGQPARFDNAAIPAVVFTDPELAWCGLTETQAKAENRPVKVVRFPWGASGRAATLGRAEGMTKLIFDPETERILGMGVVGVGAGELIAEGVLAVEMAAVARDVAESIHPHPTLSETVAESAESFFGHSTHLYRPKR